MERFTYDELDRLTEACYRAAGCPGGNHPFIRWAYDDVGNRTSESRPGSTTTYASDNADELTSQTTGGATTSY